MDGTEESTTAAADDLFAKIRTTSIIRRQEVRGRLESRSGSSARSAETVRTRRWHGVEPATLRTGHQPQGCPRPAIVDTSPRRSAPMKTSGSAEKASWPDVKPAKTSERLVRLRIVQLD